jgi:solute carrier family 35 protein F1/2
MTVKQPIYVDEESAPSSDQPVAVPSTEHAHLSTIVDVRRELFAYIKTPRFWTSVALGQVLSLCITGTSTFSGLLAQNKMSIPAFQSFFNYVLLNLVYTSWTIYRYGISKYWNNVIKSKGWKYLILCFLDVEANYFVVLAYRYTTVISAQLINFWAIVVVVVISFAALRVRYHWCQVCGILVCCGGMGLLIGRDAVRGVSPIGGALPTELKGDLFMLLGATLYGVANVAEEFLVSKTPLYEVVGQIGFWGMIVSGIQMGIFDRSQFQTAVWTPKVAAYFVGFTVLLFTFYSLLPILLRLSSAAFFNISLLTSNFYGVAIGVAVFGYTFDRFYPLAFVLIVSGLLVYFLFMEVFGEARKPWLGQNQEEGVVGVGTAKRK